MTPAAIRERPSKEKASSPIAARALEFAAPCLLLLGPFGTFLWQHRYPVDRPESLLLGLLLVLAGVGCALWIRAHPRAGVWLYGLLLASFVDFQFSPGEMMLALVPVCVVLAWLLRAGLPQIVTVSLLVFYASLPLTDVAPPLFEERGETLSHADLPPVLHILFDEHIGLGGFPPEVVGAPELAATLESFYVNWGFRVFPEAYSRYSKTLYALPNLLNFTTRELRTDYFPPGSHELSQNRYFRDMSESGYALRVYQSDFIELCQSEGARLESCFTYAANRGGNLAVAPDDTLVRLPIFAAYYFMSSELVMEARKGYLLNVRPRLMANGLPAPAWEWEGNRMTGTSVPTLFARLETDLAGEARGLFAFAHFLFPHYPYEVDATCKPHESLAKRLGRMSDSARRPGRNTPETRAERYPLYLDQIRCLVVRLDGLLRSLEQSGMLEDAVVIIHGDHGSRLAVHDPKVTTRDVVSERDLVDSFSTLFAVRAPGISPGVDSRPLPLGALLETLVETRFSSLDLEPEAHPYVFLRPRTPDLPSERLEVSWGAPADSASEPAPSPRSVTAASNGPGFAAPSPVPSH